MAGRLVFKVNVIAVSLEDADKMAESNTDVGVNFVGLDNEDQSTASGNSGNWNLAHLYSKEKGSSVAAHEFGHLLGYYNGSNNNYANKVAEDNFTTHATYAIGEKNFIMRSKAPGGPHDDSKKRVSMAEYPRLNGGKGVRINNANIPMPIVVDPSRANNDSKNLTNNIYK